MKRSDVIKLLESMVKNYDELSGKTRPTFEQFATAILNTMEGVGMTPPSVSEEDRQAIMHVYYAGYTFHQWDEDLEKDDKVQEAKKKRAEYRALSTEERKERRKKWRQSREKKQSP